MKKRIIDGVSRFDTDYFWLKRVYNSVRTSPLPDVRACLPELKAALDRFNKVNFDKYFNLEAK